MRCSRTFIKFLLRNWNDKQDFENFARSILLETQPIYRIFQTIIKAKNQETLLLLFDKKSEESEDFLWITICFVFSVNRPQAAPAVQEKQASAEKLPM